MDLNYLQEFLVLAKTENLSEAAYSLSISESSLSRHIKTLEDELNCTLFDRTPRSLKLNRYGKIYLTSAEEILQIQERSVSILKEAKLRESTAVSIVSNYYVNDFLAGFSKRHPSITVNMLESANREDALLEKLAGGKCTFAFLCDYQNNHPEYASCLFTRDSYVAALPPGHALASREAIRLNELAKEPFLSFNSDSYDDKMLKKYCREAGFEPGVIMTGNVGSEIAQFVHEGLGVSILKRDVSLKVGIDPGYIAMIPFDPPADFTVSVVYKKDSLLTKPEQIFLDAVRGARS